MPISSELRDHIQGADVIPLLCALAELTGDRQLLKPDFRPRLTAEMVTVPLNGGLDNDTAESARDQIVNAIRQYIEDGKAAGAQEQLPVEDIIDFMTAGSAEYADLMKRELPVSSEDEIPRWPENKRGLKVAIIGAGPSGLGMAHKLKNAGIDFRIFDANPNVGGTWWSNAYPGCRLDTGRLSYSFSFAQRKDWNHYYTLREDLSRYYSDFARENGILEHISFNTEVTCAQWNDADSVWVLDLKNKLDGKTDQLSFGLVVSAVGVLSKPKIIEFPGAERYKGQKVHSALWNPSVDYKNKKVSIIGTGASAYQIAPAIAGEVSELNIFQRNPPWMLPTPNYHDEVSKGSVWLVENIPNYYRWLRLWEFWHSTIGKYALTVADPDWTEGGSVSGPNLRFRKALEEHISKQYVGHEILLEKVIPKYPVGAKRMLRDNGVWAKTLQSPHVRLVTSPIREFNETSVVTEDGKSYESDLIIYATGFDVENYIGGITVVGRAGQSLREKWGDEARAFLGISVPDFPNFFCLGGPNTGLVAIGSQTFMTECGINYICESIRHLLATHSRTIEPTEDAYRKFIDWMNVGNNSMAWGAAKIHSWYRNSRGAVVASWPYSLLQYWRSTRSVEKNDVRCEPCAEEIAG